ncbi:MAG TPA: hypothetical protein PLX69_09630 [Leptospiraceae bacterium]|nr:hypothetical protein [Leptospiraceae bacterium]HRG74807.1 hypothetical protein [Leptospiraceae bacterium]
MSKETLNIYTEIFPVTKNFLLYSSWQIAFILKNEKVNDIIVSAGILGH